MSKKKKYIILIICAITLFVAILILRSALMKKEQQNKEYNNLDDFTTPKEVIEYMGGKYIKEVESPEENFYLDIYANLKVDTYTDKTSNEDYYRTTVRIMANTLKFKNFRIIDDEKKNLIVVLCDEGNESISRTYINGDDSYFATQDSKIKLDEMQEIAITEFYIEAVELNNLINNNWNKTAINTTNANEFNDYLYLESGIAVRNVYRKVFNILFESNYSNSVLNGIKTDTSLEEVVKALGKPSFGSIEEGLIGYKGTKIYAFFTGREISIYRVENYETDRLIEILKEFQDKADVKKFVSAVTDMWPDYDIYNYDEKYVNLIYALKGIKIQFNISSSHGLIVGNNYAGNIEELKNLKEELEIKEIYFDNTDFVYEAELERINSARG